jgi:hypothetical protein
MFRWMWEFLKARWAWSRGYCPSCGRFFRGSPGRYDVECPGCRGETDDLSIWSNYRFGTSRATARR